MHTGSPEYILIVGNESPPLTMHAGGRSACLMLPIKPRPNESMRCCPTMFATNPGPGKQTITSAPGFDFWSIRSMLTFDDMMSHDRKTDITIGMLEGWE